MVVVKSSPDRLEEEQSLRTASDKEEERYRIAMDLHDGVMQDLYAVSLRLDLAFEDMDLEPVRAKADVGRATDQLQAVIADIRSYLFDLRPRQFNGDLGQALLDLGREFKDNSLIETEVRIALDLPEICQETGVAYYVIAHEALSNARKNARASRVTVSLSTEAGALRLEVLDNGCGFDSSKQATEAHRGLQNMMNRASSIGADLRIVSAPDRGTSVHVSLGPT